MDIRTSNGALKTEFTEAELGELTAEQYALFAEFDAANNDLAAAELNAREIGDQLRAARNVRADYGARFAGAFRVTAMDAWRASRDQWAKDNE